MRRQWRWPLIHRFLCCGSWPNTYRMHECIADNFNWLRSQWGSKQLAKKRLTVCRRVGWCIVIWRMCYEWRWPYTIFVGRYGWLGMNDRGIFVFLIWHFITAYSKCLVAFVRIICASKKSQVSNEITELKQFFDRLALATHVSYWPSIHESNIDRSGIFLKYG